MRTNGGDLRSRSLAVLGPGRVGYHEGWVREPGDGEFRVTTLYSGISAGTELTFVKGTNPYLHRRWDDRLCAFVDEAPSAPYPVTSLGYMEVGIVTESVTPLVAPGETVAMAFGHRMHFTASAQRDFFKVLPASLDPLLGVYVAQMGPICANGLLHAAADMTGAGPGELAGGVRGRNVVVVGAGVVGLLTALFVRRHGAAAVAVADATPFRLDAAHALGFLAVDARDPKAWRNVKEDWAPGADVAFQCRATAESLSFALRTLRPQGSVIDLAFYQAGAGDVRLGEEFHHNGLVIRSAQIARVPRGFEKHWSRERLAEETLALLSSDGEALRRAAVTDVVPFDEGADFLVALAQRRRSTIQAVLDMGGAP